MRAAVLLLALVVASPSVVAGHVGTQHVCGLTVCAEAESKLSRACLEAEEGTEAVLRCTFTFVSFSWGQSQWMLPGRVFLSGDATLRWDCTAGCAADQVEKNVNAYATWWGGPFDVADQGLGPGDGGDVPILERTVELRVPSGTPACLQWRAELETTALAETPHAPRPIPGGFLEEVYAGDGALDAGTTCLR